MHWRNSNVQILYIIVGKTHTPDEAYRVLLELREERITALNSARASSLRDEAKRLLAIRRIKHSGSTTPATGLFASDTDLHAQLLNAEADIAELDSFKAQGQACIDQAAREVEFIGHLIARLEPHRQYRHLELHAAHQACQLEEWRWELVWRAENYIASTGNIPPDHLATMRMHPEWMTFIGPRVDNMMQARASGNAIGLDSPRPMVHILQAVAQEVLDYAGHGVLQVLPNALEVLS